MAFGCTVPYSQGRRRGVRKAALVMTLWFFRLVTVVIFPVIGWFKVSSDWKGIAVGVLAALFIIGVEIFIEHVPLSHILLGMLGGGLGLIFAWFINYAVLSFNEPLLTGWIQ